MKSGGTFGIRHRLIHVEGHRSDAVMTQDSDRNEWTAVKERFEELRRRESESAPALEDIFDDEIRRRFGQMISRSASARRASATARLVRR